MVQQQELRHEVRELGSFVYLADLLEEVDRLIESGVSRESIYLDVSEETTYSHSRYVICLYGAAQDIHPM